ncbi:hypothetical protein [Tahibacter amnicola]|uniref:Uncharacterized protein n=1 Tax=Tahibacter amnicola TaxID=2976241 RepID=A0ABY6BJV8_9GAMM|nr:hypothetical protein [Tahibacter amnicola]UXI70309.1 hypothetical protein N4264_11930 [Tahibacter amnicola]
MRIIFRGDHSEARKALIAQLGAAGPAAEAVLDQLAYLLGNAILVFEGPREPAVRIELSDVAGRIVQRFDPARDAKGAVRTDHVPIPERLRQFVRHSGAMRIYFAGAEVYDDGEFGLDVPLSNVPIFEMFEQTAFHSEIFPVAEAIAFHGMRPFIDDCFSAEEIKALDANIFVFAVHHRGDELRDYLFFDRNGSFGSFEFDANGYSKSQEALVRIMRREFDPEDFDPLMARFFSLSMIAFFDRLGEFWAPWWDTAT